MITIFLRKRTEHFEEYKIKAKNYNEAVVNLNEWWWELVGKWENDTELTFLFDTK